MYNTNIYIIYYIMNIHKYIHIKIHRYKNKLSRKKQRLGFSLKLLENSEEATSKTLNNYFLIIFILQKGLIKEYINICLS